MSSNDSSKSPLESFGVAGLLEDDSEILYIHLFGTLHLGRVSDLLAARLSLDKLHELKLRKVVAVGTMQAHFGQAAIRTGSLAEGSVDHLRAPLSVECGVDSKKIAIGIKVKLNDTLTLNTEGLTDRITSGTPSGLFEEMFLELHEHADHLVIKYHAESRCVEVASIIDLSTELSASLSPISEVSEELEESVSPLVAESTQKQPPQVLTLKGNVADSGSRPKAYVNMGDINFTKILKDNPFSRSTQSTSGGTNPEENIESSEAEPSDETPDDTSDEMGEEGEASGGPEVLDLEIVTTAESSQYPDKFGLDGSPKKDTPEDEALSESVFHDAGTPEFQARNLMVELTSGNLSRLTARMRSEVVAIHKEITSENANEWIDQMVRAFESEKDNLQRKSRMLYLTLRKKELTTSGKTNALQNELSKQAGQLAIKTIAVQNLTNQLEQKKAELEKIRGTDPAFGPSTKSQVATEKTIQVLQEDKSRLAQRVAQLTSDLLLARSSSPIASKKTENSFLQVKYDRLTRQNEELKKANRQLLVHLDSRKQDLSAKSEAHSQDARDMQRRLDSTTRLAAAYKKEAEAMRQRILQLEKALSTLKAG